RAGTLDRRLLVETADGKRVAVRSRRFVSLEHRHLAGIVYEVEACEGGVSLVLSSELVVPSTGPQEQRRDPRRGRHFDERVLEVTDRRARDMRLAFDVRTRSSGLYMACAVDHELRCDAEAHIEPAEAVEDRGRVVFL